MDLRWHLTSRVYTSTKVEILYMDLSQNPTVVACIYKSRNFIYGFEKDAGEAGFWIYKSRNFIYGFERSSDAGILLSTKVEILYMDLRLNSDGVTPNLQK